MWKKTKKLIWSLAFVVSLGVFIYAAYNLMSLHSAYHEAEQEYEDLVAIAFSNQQYKDSARKEGSTSPIDFASLQAINEDIVGWIVIEGTNINYPIVQGGDNETYLHTTFSGVQNASGAIFMDMHNAADFSDSQTIIYGHHMKNGTVFAALTRFQEQSFFDAHPTFTIYTPEEKYLYEIFSAYVVSAYSDTYHLAFSTGDNFTQYLQYITELSEIVTNITPSSADRIVSLSTCEYQFDDARMIVHGRLIKNY